MATTLLRQLQDELAAADVDVVVVLRKCKILARRLHSKQFAEWVDFELDGYPESAEIPAYRLVRPAHYASFSNGYWKAEKQPVPTLLIDEEYRHLFEPRLERAPIETIKELAAKGGGVLHRNELRFLLKGQIVDLPCYAFWSEVPGTQFAQIVGSVTNRLLDFVIAIEQENPDAGEAPASQVPVEQDRVVQLVTNYFQAPVANVAQQSHGFTQSVAVTVVQWRELASRAREAMREAPLESGLQATAEAQVSTIEAQVASPAPNSVILTEAGRSLRAVVEGALANVTSQPGAWTWVVDALRGLLG